MAQQLPFVLVRIKTYDKRKGHLVRRYTYQGKRFDCDHGWYKVGRAMGEELARLKNTSTDTYIFDVMELEEAKALDDKEKAEDWARTQKPAEQGSPVKVKDFKRREEIKQETAARDAENMDDGDWDDAFDPQNDLDGSEDDQEQDDEEGAEEGEEAPKASKKKAKKKASKKKASRRSASK